MKRNLRKGGSFLSLQHKSHQKKVLDVIPTLLPRLFILLHHILKFDHNLSLYLVQ